jgi:hypothetical protein
MRDESPASDRSVHSPDNLVHTTTESSLMPCLEVDEEVDATDVAKDSFGFRAPATA